jgi:Zn-dependent peptidase ImmA (M78 family)
VRQRLTTENIRELVKDLLAEVGITKPPVDLEKVAQARGARVVEEPMGTLWGSVRASALGLTIRVNQDAPLKQRFTLAHEIAHILISGPRSATRAVSTRKATAPRTERLCDRIAAELLMPYQMFAPLLKGMPANIATICTLADKFESSVHSAAIRFAELSQDAVEVMCWQRQGDRLVLISTGGRRFFRAWGSPAELARDIQDPSFGPSLAFHCDDLIVRRDTPKAGLRTISFLCESQGFGADDYRYVLTLAKPAGSAEELRARQEFQAGKHSTRLGGGKGSPGQAAI